GCARVYPNNGYGRVVWRLTVYRDTSDRHLDRDTVDVEASEAVHAEGVHAIIGVLRGGEQGQEASQVGRIKHRAEIDVEGLGPLAGEDAEPIGPIRVDALRGERLIVRHGSGSYIGRHGYEFLLLEEVNAFIAAHLSHGVRLASGQPLRAGAVEGRDSL